MISQRHRRILRVGEVPLASSVRVELYGFCRGAIDGRRRRSQPCLLSDSNSALNWNGEGNCGRINYGHNRGDGGSILGNILWLIWFVGFDLGFSFWGFLGRCKDDRNCLGQLGELFVDDPGGLDANQPNQQEEKANRVDPCQGAVGILPLLGKAKAGQIIGKIILVRSRLKRGCPRQRALSWQGRLTHSEPQDIESRLSRRQAKLNRMNGSEFRRRTEKSAVCELES